MIIPFRKKHSETIFLDKIAITLTVTVVAILVSYFFCDLPIAESLKRAPNMWKKTGKLISKLIDPSSLYFAFPILFFIVRFLYKNEKWGNRLLLLIIAVPGANLVSGCMKMLLGRARPEAFFANKVYTFSILSHNDAFLSFPSGHAATIGAICGAFVCFYPRLWGPLLAIASLLAFSRILAGAHYLSDIVAGVAVGLLTSQAIYTIMKRQRFAFDPHF